MTLDRRLPGHCVYGATAQDAKYDVQMNVAAPELPSGFAVTPAVDALRRVLQAAGLDQGRAGAPDWNPLGDLIPRGAKVCVKPNWVVQPEFTGASLDCLVTHPSVVRGLLHFVKKAGPGSVVIGDAPIQGCDFGALMRSLGMERILAELGDEIPFALEDFRLVHVAGGRFFNRQIPTGRGLERYVLFDFKGESLLEPVTTSTTEFRVGEYDAAEMKRTHAPGRHQYLVSREVIDADVVFSVPKLKTHKRAGVTGALKNVVGIAGHKSYLAHHRKGGATGGGDCYPGRNPLKAAAEHLLDASAAARSAAARGLLSGLAQLANRTNQVLGGDRNISGSWSGNDTVWRMTLDLQRILRYGRSDGTLAPQPQRLVVDIVDGIIGGEGEGPLSPRPAPLGMLTMGSSAAALEWVHCLLMGFDPARIPLVREAFGDHTYRLTSFAPQEIEVVIDGNVVPAPDIFPRFGRRFVPPAGWAGCCELGEGRPAAVDQRGVTSGDAS